MITLQALWKYHEIVERNISSEDLGFCGYVLFGIRDGFYCITSGKKNKSQNYFL